MNHLREIEAAIRKEKFGKRPVSLYEPIRYIMSLGGKRLRPMLVLLAYGLYRRDFKKVLPYAVAVEAFHNFTLMHDDIMDNAPLRRNKPTVHEKWNINTAILSGDVMLVQVYEMLSGLHPEILKAALPKFNRTAREVCEGQQLDMDFETRDTVSEKEYLEMIRLKTAVLLGFSLEFGALLAGAPESDQKLLYDFGVSVGIGFQLKDDLLDVYAEKDKFGKQVGGDIISNKKTFLLIKALERAGGKTASELKEWLEKKKFNKTEKVKAVTGIYDQLDIQSLTNKKISKYFNSGFVSIETLGTHVDVGQIKNYALVLMDRQH
ncbi:MAG: polyprenyl synthetase family protein [Cyclobacteriaceae bacterium]